MDKNELHTSEALAAIFQGLDAATIRHSQRVQRIALALGRFLGLTTAELEALSLGSLLHDVGKKYVPEEILMKTTSLSSDDWEVIRKHPMYGFNHCAAAVRDERARDIILHHHLWYDGQGGYPASGSCVCPGQLTQITTVADVVDAMTQDRPYRQALSFEDSLDFLMERKGSQFSPLVVDAVQRNFDHLAQLVQA